MTQSIEIEQKESDVIRLFAVNLPDAEAQKLAENPGDIARLLGVAALDVSYLEVCNLRDIAEMGLSQYLQDGYGAPMTDLNRDAAKLGQLGGHVVVLLSSAVTARPATLTTGAELTLIATYALNATDWRAEATPTPESAKPFTAPEATRKKPSDAAMSGRIATLVLLFLALLVVAMVWIA